MKNQGISQLILDLRYNPGGEVRVANYLASAIAPEAVVNSKEILVSYEYNDNLKQYFSDRQGADSPNIISRFEQNENNLNLNEVVILTSGTTASASELVINGLKPYMDVTVIGENTFGKFYGSYVLYDQNEPPKHNWAIAPVVLKYANANGVTDFVNGIAPDIFLEDNLLLANRFGDENDPMLATAISYINGSITSGRIASTRQYQPVYDMDRINRKNIFNSVNVFMN
jgi:C-terminal processing protease CtpA/Prc